MATPAHRFLALEARALMTRLERLRPFAVKMPMVMAAAVSPAAQAAVEGHMVRSRRTLAGMLHRFVHWLRDEGERRPAAEAQRRFTILRMRFNNVISQFEIFADVFSQRSEHETGVWVAGLDEVAADALRLPGYYDPPPVICYVDRGHGAAIRRARTRLPGGDPTPVAIIRVPRERMVGSGIASSLVHEVGHQAAALLDLVNSMRPMLVAMQRKGGPEQAAWQLWERWISEIVADFWSVARVGIASTQGLVGVVSLPRFFVFRFDREDPHPIPWVRVQLSCAMGDALFPHPQWAGMRALWQSLYPLDGLNDGARNLLQLLHVTMPTFVALLAEHRPPALRGQSLREALGVQRRQPIQLAGLHRVWLRDPARMRQAPPSLVFAVLGQARADGALGPEQESNMVSKLLNYWASRSAMNTSAHCARSAASRLPAAAAA